jgi:protein TonB
MPLPILLALTLLAQAAPEAAPSEAVLRNSPDWLRLPSDGEVAAAYPQAARRSRVTGEAALACTLDADGRLEACKVAAESPSGYGFGEAALSLAGRFQMTPLYPDGSPVTGARVSVPITFAPPHR